MVGIILRAWTTPLNFVEAQCQAWKEQFQSGLVLLSFSCLCLCCFKTMVCSLSDSTLLRTVFGPVCFCAERFMVDVLPWKMGQSPVSHRGEAFVLSLGQPGGISNLVVVVSRHYVIKLVLMKPRFDRALASPLRTGMEPTLSGVVRACANRAARIRGVGHHKQ